jgi:hypothetical protein
MANSIDDFLSKSSQAEQDKFKALVADAVNKDATPQKAKEAEKTSDAYASNDINNRTPEQAQQSKNAIEQALDKQAQAKVAEIGQTLSKEGVTVPQQDKQHDKHR